QESRSRAFFVPFCDLHCAFCGSFPFSLCKAEEGGMRYIMPSRHRQGGVMSNARIVFALVISFALLSVQPARAHVKKMVSDKKASPGFNGKSFGPAGQYETLAGRAFGELDPIEPHNAIITDIKLAPRNANGRVEYIASFFLVKPMDMSKSSHLMWQD